MDRYAACESDGRERRLERIAAAPSFSPGPTRFYGVSAPNSRHRLRSTLRGVWPAQHQHEKHHHRGPRSGRVVARQSSSGSLTSEAECSGHWWAIHQRLSRICITGPRRAMRSGTIDLPLYYATASRRKSEDGRRLRDAAVRAYKHWLCAYRHREVYGRLRDASPRAIGDPWVRTSGAPGHTMLLVIAGLRRRVTRLA